MGVGNFGEINFVVFHKLGKILMFFKRFEKKFFLLFAVWAARSNVIFFKKRKIYYCNMHPEVL
jgi:hypothetical protein